MKTKKTNMQRNNDEFFSLWGLFVVCLFCFTFQDKPSPCTQGDANRKKGNIFLLLLAVYFFRQGYTSTQADANNDDFVIAACFYFGVIFCFFFPP